MAHRWSLRCPEPTGLVNPRPVDPVGATGPTRAQARGPHWRRTSRGLYVPTVTDSGRVEQRILEAARRLPAGGAVSGWAALRMYGGNFFDGLGRDGRTPLPVPLVVPHHRNVRGGTGVVRHRQSYPSDGIRIRYGVPCLDPALALFDAARWSGELRSAVRALDLAMAAGIVTLDRFVVALDELAGRPGHELVLEAMAYAEPRTKSPRECDLRMIWRIDAGLPRPLCNWPIADADGRRIGRPDLLCEELGVVGEYDGADHDVDEVRSIDFAKEDAYRDVGLECFRVTGRDMHRVQALVERIHATVRRARGAARPRRWLRARDPGPL